MPRRMPSNTKQKAAQLVKALNRHKGNKSSLARELGITPQAVQCRVSKAPVQALLQQQINECLKEANITTKVVYDQLSKQLRAGTKRRPNWHAQDAARESALQLLGHKNKKREEGVDDELTTSLEQSDIEKLKKMICLLK